MNLARLNHILIPATRAERDRLRASLLGRLGRPLGWLYGALSDEGRVLAVLALFVGAAGLEVDSTQVYVLWSLLTGLLVASLLLRPAFRLRDVRLAVRVPPRVALGAPVTIELLLHNDGQRPRHAVRIRGPFLPWDGRWLGGEPAVAELGAGTTARVVATARFVARGEHQLDAFTAAALVPFGLAVGPAIEGGPCRFVVVPAIARIDAFDLPVGRRYQPGGVAQASRIGEALELVGVRPYRPGDAVRDLHPRTWARTRIPHVREYQQELFTRIGVILDNDRTAGSERGFEAAVSLTAGVVARLSRGEALIDLLVIGDRIHALTIGRSLGFFEQALDQLACAAPAPPIDHERLLLALEPYLGRLSCMVLVTQSAGFDRLALAAAIEERAVACRILRVHDDTAGRWLGRPGAEVPGPRAGRERIVTVTRIERRQELGL